MGFYKHLIALFIPMIFLMYTCSISTSKVLLDDKKVLDHSIQNINKVAYSVSSFEGSPDEIYYMLVPAIEEEYWLPVYEMFKQGAEQIGVKTVYTGSNGYDVEQEITVFEEVVSKKPAGIFLHSLNSDAFVEPVKKAIESGVPVVTFTGFLKNYEGNLNGGVPRSKIRVHFTTDTESMGIASADAVCNAIGGVGKICLVINPGQASNDGYIKAVNNRIIKKWPKIEIEDIYPTSNQIDESVLKIKLMLQANPDLNAILASGLNQGIGAALAVDELHRDIKIFSKGISTKALDMIKEGKIYGIVCPEQGNKGYFGILTLFLCRHSEMVDPMTDYKTKKVSPINLPSVDTGYNIITQENVDFFYYSSYSEKRNKISGRN